MTKTAIHTVYRNLEGKRVPSVTTYLGILNKPALLKWAWQCGIDQQDYLKVRDFAAEVGTLVHDMVDCKIRGVEPDTKDYSPEHLAAAQPPMDKFNDWVKDKELEPILMEVPLVSIKYQYGGKPDFYGKVNGVLTLLDYKTGLDVYQEAFYQTAAYKMLLEENKGLMYLEDGDEWVKHPIFDVEEIKILRLGKSEDEGFHEVAVTNIEKNFQIFLRCRDIYELQRKKPVK
jgi:hypothetical protein